MKLGGLSSTVERISGVITPLVDPYPPLIQDVLSIGGGIAAVEPSAFAADFDASFQAIPGSILVKEGTLPKRDTHALRGHLGMVPSAVKDRMLGYIASSRDPNLGNNPWDENSPPEKVSDVFFL